MAVIGAGLAGCLLATLLGRRGVEVTVYERRGDPRRGGVERGRSINLAISARGLDALERVGLREQILARALPMHGRMVHPIGRASSFRPYSADGQRAINSISRHELNGLLLDAAGAVSGVTLRFSHRLAEFDVATGRMIFATPDGMADERAGIVFGADGAYSAARRAMLARDWFDYRQDILEYGYKELTILPRAGDFALDPDALHIWPRGSSMMIALPNPDRSFTCTLFMPRTGADSYSTLDAREKVTSYFGRHYLDVVDLMPTLWDDYQHNPVGSLVTVRTWPWVIQGGDCAVALVGDAAHAILPFFGQGANCALEDCIEIERCLAEAGGIWEPALARYQERRKMDADAIAEMSLDNFEEMRNKVASPIFRMATAAEHALERRLGGRYRSRYELVAFTTMPYAQIPGRLRRQNAGLAAVLASGVVAACVAAVVTRGYTRRRRH